MRPDWILEAEEAERLEEKQRRKLNKILAGSRTPPVKHVIEELTKRGKRYDPKRSATKYE